MGVAHTNDRPIQLFETSLQYARFLAEDIRFFRSISKAFYSTITPAEKEHLCWYKDGYWSLLNDMLRGMRKEKLPKNKSPLIGKFLKLWERAKTDEQKQRAYEAQTKFIKEKDDIMSQLFSRAPKLKRVKHVFRIVFGMKSILQRGKKVRMTTYMSTSLDPAMPFFFLRHGRQYYKDPVLLVCEIAENVPVIFIDDICKESWEVIRDKQYEVLLPRDCTVHVLTDTFPCANLADPLYDRSERKGILMQRVRITL